MGIKSFIEGKIAEKFGGYPCALPDQRVKAPDGTMVNLRDATHWDWPFWPLTKIPRAYNARGPRCGKGNPGYLPWPPRLVEGHGIARWENSGATSILEIPVLADITVKGEDVYGKELLAIERHPGNPEFGKVFMKRLDWYEAEWDDTTIHSPSALQKFSMRGWMRLDPLYTSSWRIKTRREFPGAETGEDSLWWFTRNYNRPDHLDVYYNTEIVRLPVAQFGFKWE